MRYRDLRGSWLALSLLFLVLVLFSACSEKLNTEPDYNPVGGGELLYTLLEGGAGYEVSQGTIREPLIDIPSVHPDGRPITRVAVEAFAGNEYVTLIIVPNSVSIIGEGAFSNCKNLVSVSLPTNSDFTQIAMGVFAYSYNLADLDIPDTVTQIGDSAFLGCSRLAGKKEEGQDYFEFKLPAGLTTIGNRAFQECSRLEKIVIPNSVSQIAASAFYGCSLLAEIILPSNPGFDKLSRSVLSNCTSLRTIYIPDTVSTIEDFAFAGCIALGSGDGYIRFPNNPSFRVINSSVFNNCRGLLSITIPRSIEELGSLAFAGCNSLSTVNFEEPVSITRIPEGAFMGCLNLGRRLYPLVLPNSITEIEDYAFAGCDSLYQIELPVNIREIKSTVFNNTGLRSITIPENVETIGARAFENLKHLKSVTFLTNRITTIEAWTFAGCDSLTTISLPDGVNEIMDSAFEGCKQLSTITLPQNNALFTEIKSSVFNGCVSLSSINIPDSVTNIRRSAFEACEKLVDVTLPNNAGFTSIEERTFYGCRVLRSTAANPLVIPNSVTRIGDSAFQDCAPTSSTAPAVESQFSFIELPPSVRSIGVSAFEGSKWLSSVILPQNNPLFTTISSRAFFGCKGLKSTEENLLLFPDTITTIEASAFQGCDNTNFKVINLPNSLITGGNSAFMDCVYLETVTFPQSGSLTHIGDSMFQGCRRLISGGTTTDPKPLIVIPEGVTEIGASAFRGVNLDNFTQINLPNSVISIGNDAFRECSYLTTFTLPINSNFTTIPDNMFLGCYQLTSTLSNPFIIPTSVTRIGVSAFQNIDGRLGSVNFRSLFIPASVLHIGVGAFSGCKATANGGLTIYAEVEEEDRPEGWQAGWRPSDSTNRVDVIWGQTGIPPYAA